MSREKSAIQFVSVAKPLLIEKKTANPRWKFIVSEWRETREKRRKKGRSTDFILHFQINYYHLTSVL